MARDTNIVVLTGRLTRDPELRTPGGVRVLEGRLAFTRREKKGGAWNDVSNYVDVTLGWNERAEALAGMLSKGSMIAVTGELRYREWEKDGQKRNALDIDCREVQLLDRKGDRPSGSGSGLPVDSPSGGGAGDLDDVPFAPSYI
jgi:single-strand DNA-binding protein